MKTFIYTLTDPRTNQIRYVGKSVNLRGRIDGHMYNKKKTHCSCWIQSLMKLGEKPILDIIDCVENDWQFWEQHYISLFKTWGFDLTNHTNGGEGNDGKKLSESTKKKMSLAHKGKQYALGTVHTEEYKQNLKLKLTGNKRAKGAVRTIETRRKLSENNSRANAVLTEEEVIQVCQLINQGLKGRGIKKQVPKIKPHILWNIKNGKSWKHITSKYLTNGNGIS